MFYLVLPSSSSHAYYPNNDPGHYFTKLPQEICLEGEWEVGLSELQLQNTVGAVFVDDLWLEFMVYNKSAYRIKYNDPSDISSRIKIHIPNGAHYVPDEIVTVINDAIQRSETSRSFYRTSHISYNTSDKTFTFHLFRKYLLLKMSPNLQSLLCFDRNNLKYETSTSNKRFHRNFGRIYIYSNIVSERVVGDSMVPLLRSIPLGETEDVVYRLYERPFYVPIKTRQFGVIEVLLRDERGRNVAFGPDSSTEITLHFRRAKN